MIPGAAALKEHYPELGMPVEIVAGDADRVAAAKHNSVRLHGDIEQSGLTLVPEAGHMVQYFAQGVLVEAVERVVQADLDLRARLRRAGLGRSPGSEGLDARPRRAGLPRSGSRWAIRRGFA
eukprot:gene44077-54774_t